MKISLGYKHLLPQESKTTIGQGQQDHLYVFRGAYIKQSQYDVCSTMTVSSPSITASANSMVVSVCHFTYFPAAALPKVTGSTQSASLLQLSAAWYRTYPTGGTTASNLKSREGRNYCTSATLSWLFHKKASVNAHINQVTSHQSFSFSLL